MFWLFGCADKNSEIIVLIKVNKRVIKVGESLNILCLVHPENFGMEGYARTKFLGSTNVLKGDIIFAPEEMLW